MKVAVLGRLPVSFGHEVEIVPSKEETLADLYLIAPEEARFSRLLALRSDRKRALVPIYLVERPEDPRLLELADGQWRGEETLAEASKIQKRVAALSPLSGRLSDTEHRLLLFLRFLWSRGREEFQAFPEVTSRLGYHYPLLQAFLGLKPGEEVDHLEQLTVLGLIRPSRLINRVPLCPQDGHYQLVFRETCPQCGSLRLEETELYYHFDCGYVGPREEFFREDLLRCPKCHRALHHLGVDYEIPNRVFRCLDCQYLAEEPRVEVFCLHCGRSYPLEALRFYEVQAYRLTALGLQAAEEGQLPVRAVEDIFDRLNLVRWNVFQFVVEWERQKYKRYQHPFSLLIVSWDWKRVEELAETYGITALRTYFEEVIRYLRESLRAVDIGARYTLGRYFFLLPETPRDKAEIVRRRLAEKIKHIETDLPAPEVEFQLASCPGELEETDLETLLRERRL